MLSEYAFMQCCAHGEYYEYIVWSVVGCCPVSVGILSSSSYGYDVILFCSLVELQGWFIIVIRYHHLNEQIEEGPYLYLMYRSLT